jgi:hypothetical protein
MGLGVQAEQWTVALGLHVIEQRGHGPAQPGHLLALQLRGSSRPGPLVQLRGGVQPIDRSSEGQAHPAGKGAGRKLLIRPADRLEQLSRGLLPGGHRAADVGPTQADLQHRAGAVQHEAGAGESAGIQDVHSWRLCDTRQDWLVPFRCVLGHCKPD